MALRCARLACESSAINPFIASDPFACNFSWEYPTHCPKRHGENRHTDQPEGVVQYSGGSREGARPPSPSHPPYFQTKLRPEGPKKKIGDRLPSPLSKGPDKPPKPPSQLRFSLPSNLITITSNEPGNTETQKTDRNPPITNHNPWPFEPVKVKFCFLRGPLRWLTAAKNAIVSWLLNFRIRMFVKSAVIFVICLDNEKLHGWMSGNRWTIPKKIKKPTLLRLLNKVTKAAGLSRLQSLISKSYSSDIHETSVVNKKTNSVSLLNRALVLLAQIDKQAEDWNGLQFIVVFENLLA